MGKSAIDPIFKQIITTLFQGWGINVQTEVEVGQLPLRIDVVIGIEEVPAVSHSLQDETPYGHFLNDNILEFKGEGDRLTIKGFHRILGRCHLYLSNYDGLDSEITVTIICAGTPRTVLSHPEIGFQQIAEGYYFCNVVGMKVYLIAINELPIVPANHSLLLFASSTAKRKEIIENIVKSTQGKYVEYALLLHPQITMEVTMANRLGISKENIELIAQYLGSDLIDALTPSQRLEGLSLAQRLEGLSLEDIRDSLSDEERQTLRQLLDKQAGDTQI